MLILYLEDNPRDAELVRDKLHQMAMPHELRIVSDRSEYETALSRTRFDLVLSDHALSDYEDPAFRGYPFCDAAGRAYHDAFGIRWGSAEVLSCPDRLASKVSYGGPELP
jgi:CheY-like chemotaxis protein